MANVVSNGRRFCRNSFQTPWIFCLLFVRYVYSLCLTPKEGNLQDTAAFTKQGRNSSSPKPNFSLPLSVLITHFSPPRKKSDSSRILEAYFLGFFFKGRAASRASLFIAMHCLTNCHSKSVYRVRQHKCNLLSKEVIGLCYALTIQLNNDMLRELAPSSYNFSSQEEN